MFTVAVLGIGQRGRAYSNVIMKRKDAKIVAICDINKKLLNGMSEKYKVPKENRYDSDEEFFAKGKLANTLIIATMDKDHYRHAIAALNLGYNLLLEKPVSDNIKECEEITNLAKKKGLVVIVCYVLRYAKFYQEIKKVIDSGAIGKITNFTHTENVAYWHFAHSYVRGNWHRGDLTTPSLLAKCCHDFDIWYWFLGKKAKFIESFGEISQFKKENAPKNSTERCFDCPERKTCAYAADKIYYRFTKYTIPYFIINWKIITGLPKPTLKDVKESLKRSDYGRCVYKMDNNVFDTETTLLDYGDGTTGVISMTAFSKGMYRKISIHGTKGEIFGIDGQRKFKVIIFGNKCKWIKTGGTIFDMHAGGDKGLVNDFLDFMIYKKENPYLTFMSESVESHREVMEAYNKAVNHNMEREKNN